MTNLRFAMHAAARLCPIALMLVPLTAWCGAPFTTDDPGIVDTGHVELLAFHQSTLAASDRTGTVAGIESHFGVADRFEVDLTTPLAFSKASGERTQTGYGDTTLAFKYRLSDESDVLPLVSIVPRVNFATGNASRALGNGGTQIFLGASAQKSLGDYQTYATAGYWLNRGPDNRNFAFAGWVIQREFGSHWTFGVELFANSAPTTAKAASAGFNAGGYYKFDEHDQLLFSAGRGLVHAAENNRVSVYFGYLHAF